MNVVKSDLAFRTISEVSKDLDLPQHVLRFWETKFLQIRPVKRGGGRRYYRPEDLEWLRRIKALLYDDGFTIKGAQKVLGTNSIKKKGSSIQDKEKVRSSKRESNHDSLVNNLEDILSDLRVLRRDLSSLN
ncbi:MAG: MerR family transcriptional regulator [Magnetovibrio sp.]|nr:MerR family transcriptional regulator [Magnetovibrio sp.]